MDSYDHVDYNKTAYIINGESNMLAYKTNIGENGRIIIPAKMRKDANLVVGQGIIINLQNGELKISSYNAKLKSIQETVKSYTKDKGSLVDKLYELRKEDQNNE
jgi:bifunctional DNA-binding transcriptional regulator/antitoxin component of YhaV-PrlF toxin-antitoxin module